MVLLIPNTVPVSDLRHTLARTIRSARVCKRAMRLAQKPGVTDMRLYSSAKKALARFDERAEAYRSVLASREGAAA